MFFVVWYDSYGVELCYAGDTKKEALAKLRDEWLDAGESKIKKADCVFYKAGEV